MSFRSAAFVCTLAVAAGCVAPAALEDATVAPAPDVPADWAALALPSGSGHDHYDRSAHARLSTPNFELLGHDPLVTEAYGTGAGGYLCADANGNDTRRVAVVHSLAGTSVAFVVVDITDPLAPQKIGELVLRGTTARDVAVTEDTQWVVVALDLPNEGSLAEGLPIAAAPVSATFTDACGVSRAIPLPGDGPFSTGVLLVSLADPAAPVVADYFPAPVLGGHSVGVDRIDGVDIVTLSVTNGAQHASYFMFFTIESDALALQSVYQHRPVAANAPALNLHNDGWIRKHPVTGQAIAYLADWDAGLALVDVTDIKSPKDVGRWSDYDATKGLDNSAAVHSVFPLHGTWGDKHYTLIGQEILARPAETPTGVISILDTTDPAAPKRVAAWTLPVDVEWGGALMFSTHYLTVVDRTAFVSMYHGGVWAIDLSDPLVPRTVGVYVPAIDPPDEPEGQGFSWAPTIMEVKALDTGDLAIWDSTSGLYLVRFDATMVMPAVEEWPMTI